MKNWVDNLPMAPRECLHVAAIAKEVGTVVKQCRIQRNCETDAQLDCGLRLAT